MNGILSSIGRWFGGKGAPVAKSMSAAAWLRGEESGATERMTRPYAQSAWVQSAIKKVAQPISAVGVDFYAAGTGARGRKGRGQGRAYLTSRGVLRRDDSQAVELPAMEAFLRSPMEGMDQTDLVEATVGWLKLAGESFWILPDEAMMLHANDRRSFQIILARPDRMRHVEESGTIKGWVFTDARGRSIPLLSEQVIHTKFWNPYDPFRGLGEFEAARIAADSAWLAGKFKRNLMAGNGDTGPYVVAKSGIPDDTQREQILEELRRKRAATLRGDFRPIFLSGDIAVEDPRIRQVDAAFIAGQVEDRHEIYVAFGVPPSMADVKAAYSIGSASDFYQLITTTCIPTGEKFSGALEKLARKMIGQEVECLLDWNQHPVMQEVRKERLQAVDALWMKGMPMEEISEYLGLALPEYPGWDRGYLPFSVVPVGQEDLAPTEDPFLQEETEGTEDGKQGDGSGEQGAGDGPVGEALRSINGVLERADTTAAWESHMRKRKPTVKAFESKVRKVLMDFRAETLRKLEAMKLKDSDGEHSSRRALHTKGIIDLIFDAARFGEALKLSVSPIMSSALQTAGEQLFAEIGFRDPWKMPPIEAVKFIQERTELVAGCSQTARQQLNTALEQGFNEGLSADELADQVKGVFNNLSNYEARRIAQTETQAAYSTARQSAMKRAGVRFKSWLSSHGPNVRVTHAAAEIKYGNDPIPVDEPFIVGGEELMYPGDPAGSPGNIINCQCVALSVKGKVES